MTDSLTKFFDDENKKELQKLKQDEIMLRNMAKKHWKDKELSGKLTDALISTKELIKIYETKA